MDAPRADIRVITLAGLLTCVSTWGRAFPAHWGPVDFDGRTLRLQLRGQSRTGAMGALHLVPFNDESPRRTKVGPQ
jgi:hypothetical protein